MSEANYVTKPSEIIPEQDRNFTVTELCPHCTHEIEMRWDTDTLGFQTFCPVCGERLMLCDACRHTNSPAPCDYSSETGRCRRMPAKRTTMEQEL